MARVRQVLADPRAAFADAEPSLFAPLVIVVAYGAVALVTVAPILVAVADRLPTTVPIEVAVGAQEISAPGIPVAIVALGIPLILLMWGIVSGIAYGGARILGGEGDLLGTVAFVGWGFLPKLLSAVVLAIVAFVVAALSPETTFVELLVGSSRELDVTSFSIEGSVGALMPAIFLLELVASLAMAYVWYGGLTGRHALDRRRAIAFTAVLFLLFNGI